MKAAAAGGVAVVMTAADPNAITCSRSDRSGIITGLIMVDGYVRYL